MFRLRVDGQRWRKHLGDVWQPSMVPVVKGNGYGLGHERLHTEAEFLGADVVAVGTYFEVPANPPGDILVLTPWRPFLDAPERDDLIHTVSRPEDLEQIPEGSRAVVELRTSMCRHGLTATELGGVAADLGRIRFEGWSLHLPVGDRTGVAGNLAEAGELARLAASVRKAPVWVSHVPNDRLGEIADDVRLRIGTDLWLGDRGALRPTATVLDVHRVRAGERVGYHQHRVPAPGHIVVVSGGTAHGIALEAPASGASVVQRAKTFAKGSLEAAGLALSPFTIEGKQRWFAEPPHMQSSLLFLPKSFTPPDPGTEVPVNVRFTTATFDEVAID